MIKRNSLVYLVTVDARGHYLDTSSNGIYVQTSIPSKAVDFSSFVPSAGLILLNINSYLNPNSSSISRIIYILLGFVSIILLFEILLKQKKTKDLKEFDINTLVFKELFIDNLKTNIGVKFLLGLSIVPITVTVLKSYFNTGNYSSYGIGLLCFAGFYLAIIHCRLLKQFLLLRKITRKK